jgi:hypothetical protein
LIIHALKAGGCAQPCFSSCYDNGQIYVLTLIGPIEANTGFPLEKDFTAAFAKNEPINVLVIACLLDFADLDSVDNPLFRSPARKDFIALPALVCSRSAKAAPVSIMLIPNCLGALRLDAFLRLATMYF